MHMMAYNQGKPHVHGPPTLVNRYSRYRAAIPRQRQVAAIERNPRIARSARCDKVAIQESKDSQGYKTEKRPSTLVIELVNNGETPRPRTCPSCHRARRYQTHTTLPSNQHCDMFFSWMMQWLGACRQRRRAWGDGIRGRD